LSLHTIALPVPLANYGKNMTSFGKPEVHNIATHAARGRQRHGHSNTENSTKFGRVGVSGTDRQTDRQIYDYHNTPFPTGWNKYRL